MLNFTNTSLIQTFLAQFILSVNTLGIGGSITWYMRIKNLYINVGFLTTTSPEAVY